MLCYMWDAMLRHWSPDVFLFISVTYGTPCHAIGHRECYKFEYFLPSRISNPALLPGFQGFPRAGSSTSESRQVFI